MRRVACAFGVFAVLLLCSTAAQATVVGREPYPADASSPPHVMSAASSSLAPAQTGTAANSSNGTAFDPDSVLMLVDVRANGSATWQVEYRFQLTEPGERESFESFRQDIERNTSRYTAQFVERVRPSVTAAERETGRRMAIENVSVTASRQRLAQPTGIVTYQFTWRQFARSNGSAIQVGDAIRGFYVGPTTTLTVTWPTGYRLEQSIPEPDTERQHRLSWQGELGFAADEPLVLVRSSTSQPPARTTTTAATTTATAGPPSSDGVSPLLLGAAGLLLAVLGAGGVVAARTRREDSTPNEGDGDTTTGAATPDADLLSDEERALAVIEDAGGRIKQQQLADACEWNDSKVSRVVSSLREEEEVEVFRLGRENVISLPEETDDL